jgi:hypothetical protein
VSSQNRSNRSHLIFHVRYLDHHKNFHITNQVSTNKTKALCRHLRSILPDCICHSLIYITPKTTFGSRYDGYFTNTCHQSITKYSDICLNVNFHILHIFFYRETHSACFSYILSPIIGWQWVKSSLTMKHLVSIFLYLLFVLLI